MNRLSSLFITFKLSARQSTLNIYTVPISHIRVPKTMLIHVYINPIVGMTLDIRSASSLIIITY